MDRFELSERWCGWRDLDVIFIAARVAIEAGPFDPPICEVVFDEESTRSRSTRSRRRAST
jgi:hypothetical protein